MMQRTSAGIPHNEEESWGRGHFCTNPVTIPELSPTLGNELPTDSQLAPRRSILPPAIVADTSVDDSIECVGHTSRKWRWQREWATAWEASEV